VKGEGDSIDIVNHEVRLFPTTQTQVDIAQRDDEMYIGEEKIFELATNQFSNIKPEPIWTRTNDGDQYKITKEDGRLRLHILPNQWGNRRLTIKLKTFKPAMDQNNLLVYDYPEIDFPYQISPNRLAFLQANLNEITLDDVTRIKGIRIELINHRDLTLNKTYLVEAQEDLWDYSRHWLPQIFLGFRDLPNTTYLKAAPNPGQNQWPTVGYAYCLRVS